MAQDLNSIIQTSPEPNTYYIKVDPQGTYLNTSYDFDVHVASSFELSDMFKDTTYPLKEGDLISLVSVGAFSYSSWISDYLVSDICAVFTDYSNHPIKYGDLTTAPPCYTLATNIGNNSTDIPEDFQLNNFSTVYAQVPVGAKRIRFTVNDSYFSDNTDANGDLGVYIKLKVIRTDLSLGQLIFPNAKPDINDGLPVVQIGVPTQMNVPVSINSSGPITSDVLNASVPIALQIGSQLYTQYISISTLAANQNYMVVPFTVTFKPEDAGLSTVTATINASEALKETNYTNNKVQQQVHVQYQYKIVKEVSLGTTLQSNDTEISVEPSKLSGCNAHDSEIKRVKIKLTCVKELGDGREEHVEGCKIKNTLNWYNKGPHQHTSDVGGNSTEDSLEHLGKLTTNINGTIYDISGELLDIPLSGLELVYGVPPFAGKYSVDFDEAKDPDNQDLSSDQGLSPTRVIIRASIAKGLTALNDLLAFKALAPDNKESHPYEGYFGTPLLHDRLSIALAQYREEVNKFNETLSKGPITEAFARQLTVPRIVSEAASLSWGGLYDTKRNWQGPHCTHRNGKHIDISMSPFDKGVMNAFLRKRYKKKLKEAVLDKKANLRFGYGEGPEDGKDHWHVQY